MMIKKLTALLLTLAVAACMCVAACATETGIENIPDGPESKAPVFEQVSGKITPWGDNNDSNTTSVYLKPDGGGEGTGVVIHLGDADLVDAATGLPLELEYLEPGNMLYAWTGPAMTMSLPPQANGIIAVGNISDGMPVPEYHELADYARENPDGTDTVLLNFEDGSTLTVPRDVIILPWLTRQMVTLDGLRPGSRVLVWKDIDNVPVKIVEFVYPYRADVKIDELGTSCCVNGDVELEFDCRTVGDGIVLIPLRAVAEAAGYEVYWDRDTKSAVAALDGEIILRAVPGSNKISTPSGEVDINSPCVLENGVTYLSAGDLAAWLGIYTVRG